MSHYDRLLHGRTLGEYFRSSPGGCQMRQTRPRRLHEDAHDLIDATGKLKISDFEVKVIELVRSEFGIDDQVEKFRALLEAREAENAVDMAPEQPGGEIEESYSRIRESVFGRRR